MKNIIAVAMTAAVVLTAMGSPAVAQDEKITFDGLIWFDRNGNTTKEADEPVRANVPGVRVLDAATKVEVARVDTDADGRYSVSLPAGPEYRLETLGMFVFGNTTEPIWFRKESGTFNFGQRGGVLTGRSFVDLNRNGAKDEGEEALSPGTINGKAVDVQPDGRFALVDLPRVKYEFVAAEYRRQRLLLDGEAKRTFEIVDSEPKSVDFLFWKPKGDLATTEPVVSPAKDAYVVGDEVEMAFQIINKSEATENRPSFVLASWGAENVEVLSFSDNVEQRPGSPFEFDLKQPLAPGKSIDVEVKAKLTGVTVEWAWVVVRPSQWGVRDPFGDNTLRRPVKVVEKGAETTTPTTSPTQTTTPTTTTPAVAKAGNRSGLASTGASPLGFIALGSLLLLAGAGVFLAARRRRS